MRIRFLSGPRAGQVDHCPQSQEIQVLLGAGLIEEIPVSEEEGKALRFGTQAPISVPTPQWSVVRHSNGDVIVLRKSGYETHYFGGVPDPAKWPDLTKERAKELAEQFERMVEENLAVARANAAERQKAVRR